MGLLDVVKRIFRKPERISDSQRVRNMLVREVVMATDLAWTMSRAYNKGSQVRITIQVDGTDCDTGVLATGREPLIEYFANWACAEKITKEDRLDEFDRGQEEYERDRIKCLEEVKRLQQANALQAKHDDAPDREGFGA